jgi:hypothetical protein
VFERFERLSKPGRKAPRERLTSTVQRWVQQCDPALRASTVRPQGDPRPLSQPCSRGGQVSGVYTTSQPQLDTEVLQRKHSPFGDRKDGPFPEGLKLILESLSSLRDFLISGFHIFKKS